jgi:hypothetical protein
MRGNEETPLLLPQQKENIGGIGNYVLKKEYYLVLGKILKIPFG